MTEILDIYLTSLKRCRSGGAYLLNGWVQDSRGNHGRKIDLCFKCRQVDIDREVAFNGRTYVHREWESGALVLRDNKWQTPRLKPKKVRT